MLPIYGGVAQLGEHLLCKQGVIGSIPFISTTRLSLDARPALEQGEGRKFFRAGRSVPAPAERRELQKSA